MSVAGQKLPCVARDAERPAQLGLVGVESGHCHYSFHSYAAHAHEPAGRRRQLLEVEPSLGSFARGIDLNETLYRPPAIAAERVDRIRETRAVERMKHCKSVDRLHLVALKVSDQVPTDRLADFRHF